MPKKYGLFGVVSLFIISKFLKATINFGFEFSILVIFDLVIKMSTFNFQKVLRVQSLYHGIRSGDFYLDQ